jgi:4-diphosphocytidyl-2-C-methyl-D-erythritol kinase
MTRATAGRLAAQAKVNLRLRILAREALGYHTIETVFHRIALADDVLVRVDTRGRSIECVGADSGPAERNLAYRAAVAYAETSGWPTGFRVEITKRIPVGGGLGGGSADAAAVLRILQALAPTPLTGPRLRDLAASLGADVPFLTTTDPMALAWGRGERMLGLPALPRRRMLLVVAAVAIATADAYGWWDEAARPTPVESWRKTPDQLGDWSAIERMAENDFEAVVFPRYPALARHAEWLRSSGAAPALLTGTGATVFGVFGPESRLPTIPRGPVRVIETVIGDAVADVEVD